MSKVSRPTNFRVLHKLSRRELLGEVEVTNGALAPFPFGRKCFRPNSPALNIRKMCYIQNFFVSPS